MKKKHLIVRITGIQDSKIHQVMMEMKKEYPMEKGYLVTNVCHGDYYNTKWNVFVEK